MEDYSRSGYQKPVPQGTERVWKVEGGQTSRRSGDRFSFVVSFLAFKSICAVSNGRFLIFSISSFWELHKRIQRIFNHLFKSLVMFQSLYKAGSYISSSKSKKLLSLRSRRYFCSVWFREVGLTYFPKLGSFDSSKLSQC